MEGGNLIRAVRDAQTKKKLYDELTPLSKFIGDLRGTSNAPGNGSLTPNPSPTGEGSGNSGGNTGGNTGGNNGGGGGDDEPNEN